MSIEKFFYWQELDEVVVVGPIGDGGSFAEEASREVWEELFQQVIASGKDAVIDFGSLRYFGSAMMDFVVSLNRAIRDRGQKIAICGVSPTGMEVMKIAKFDILWPIRTTLEAAMEAVKE